MESLRCVPRIMVTGVEGESPQSLLFDKQEKIKLEAKILSSILQDIFYPHEVYHVQKKIMERITIIENISQEIETFGSQCPDWPVDEELKTQILETVHCGRQALHKLQYIFDADRFHGSCLRSRATRLLQHKPVGTYLLRCEEDCFVVDYQMQKISEHFFKIKGDGTCFSKRGEPQEFNDYLQQIIQLNVPLPLAHRPLDHLLAQVEHQVCGATAAEMAKTVDVGGCFITSQQLGSYELHRVERNRQLGNYSIQVQADKLICQKDDQQIETASFAELLTAIFQKQCYRLFYKVPEVELAERICYCRILPEMQAKEQRVAKISRRTYRHLPCSVLVIIDNAGKIQLHEKKHKKNFTTADGEQILGERNKGFLGEGSFKFVWSMKPFYTGVQAPMVRARFKPNKTAKAANIAKNIELLASEVEDHTHLLFSITFTYLRGNGLWAYGQVMPLMEGKDLFQAVKDQQIDFLAGLKAIRDAGLGMLAMHNAGWAHRDFKPENIFLDAINKLGDFDLICKAALADLDTERVGSPLYMDPDYIVKNSKGEEGVLLNDQFGFGATLYYHCMKKLLRGYAKDIDDLLDVVTDADLNAPGYATLDDTLQQIIINCCIGAASERSYQLRLYLAALSQVIIKYEQLTHYS